MLSHVYQFVQDGLFESKQLSHARPSAHAIEMRRAVLEWSKACLEVLRATHAPEEMSVGRSEMIEEKLSSGQQMVRDLKVFEELGVREATHTVRAVWNVADLVGRIDPSKKWVDT